MPIILLLLLGFLWAARLAAIKTAGVAGVPVHVAVPFALMLAALAFNLLALVRGSWAPITRQTLPFFLFSGLCGMVLPFVLEMMIAPRLTVFVFFVIIATSPVLTLTLGSLLGLEKPRGRQAIAIAFGFTVALLVASDSVVGSPTGTAQWWWVAAAFAVPLLYAINSLYIASYWPNGIDALQAAQAQSLFMSAAMVVGSLATGLISDWSLVQLHLPAVLGIGLLETLAILVYLEVIRRAGASFVSLANYVAIVLAAGLGFLLFDERITWLSVTAALILIASLSFAQPNPSRKRGESQHHSTSDQKPPP